MHNIDSLVRDIVEASTHDAEAADMLALLRTGSALEVIRHGAQAIEHVLGFCQLRLGCYRGRLVRLHFWNGDVPQVADVHSHVWPFDSYVLAGEITNRNFTVEDDPRASAELVRVDYANDGLTRRVPLGRKVRCEERAVSVVGRGQSYDLSAEQFHCSAAMGSSAVTMLVTGTGNRSPYVVQYGMQSEREFPLRLADPSAMTNWFDYLCKIVR